ncbi:thioredoxin family protein [Thiomicrorhabdus aquaedulcis]|uniref:thioredoxin family protein n=1 Tax=Thiomicrorhabdus aquaedulcis TaxID=2211106 RepID=UPI000FD9AFBA|nr:thioredoxin family protein [Thiomicrorhabdus aquaedulcis]
MASLTTPICDFNQPAPQFNLLGVDGQYWTLDKARGQNGLLIMFISNHCPYVKAIHARLVQDTQILRDQFGINSLAIMSNDTTQYPEDAYENMQTVAQNWQFPFAYVIDPTQETAKAYGAVCTPDFFGYNAQLQLQYRGRLDESRKETAPQGVRRDLLEALKQVAQTGQGPQEQIPSMGCSIKWR